MFTNKAKILSDGGAHRLVYSIGTDTVLKRLRKHTYSDNIREYDRWQYYKNRPEGKYLTPIYRLKRGKALDHMPSSSAFLYMERLASTLEQELDKQNLNWIEQLEHPIRIEMQRIAQSMGIRDIHAANVGYRYNGELVLLDYGSE